MVHPEHVERAAQHWVVQLGGLHDVAGAECVATVAELGVFGALVANSHAARADRGRRLIGQISLGWWGMPADE